MLALTHFVLCPRAEHRRRHRLTVVPVYLDHAVNGIDAYEIWSRSGTFPPPPLLDLARSRRLSVSPVSLAAI
jgi:hypothetical protein